MEYDPLEIEFSADPTVAVGEVDLDTLFKNMNENDYTDWFSTEQVEVSGNIKELSSPQTLEFESPEYEALSVLPLENWTENLVFIKPEPESIEMNEVLPQEPITRAPVKRETKKPSRRNVSKKSKRSSKVVKEEVDDKYLKRLEANKLSAQASRERKKQLKTLLEDQMTTLSEENKKLGTEITQLETENKVLKSEFVQLQTLIYESPILSKMMAQQFSMSLPSIEEMEQKKMNKLQERADATTPPLFTPSLNSDPAALMYLMVMLRTFGQYFNTQAVDINTTQMPNTPLSVM